jgi:hypothetical protein
MAEMNKGRDEDKLWNQTLKTIEIININDMAIERSNLEKLLAQLQTKQKELDTQENKYLKEKYKRDEKKRKYNAKHALGNAE